jgi:hypothetical protein
MEIAHPSVLWLIAPLLAIAFLLWVLWNLIQEDRKHRARARVVYPLQICASVGENLSGFHTLGRGVRGSGETSARPLAHWQTR